MSAPLQRLAGYDTSEDSMSGNTTIGQKGIIGVGPIRVGLIGYGFAGKTFHAPLIRCVPGLELTVVGYVKFCHSQLLMKLI